MQPDGTKTLRPLADWGAVIVVCATALFWWTATDRLDLPKQWILVGATLLVVAAAVLEDDRMTSASLVVCLVFCSAWLGAREEMSARVEGWAGWVGAAALVGLARRADPGRMARALAGLACGLSLIAWLQALGLPLFNRYLDGMQGRRVVATLGGPGHLGWTLAALLPWTADFLMEIARPYRPHDTKRVMSAALLSAVVLGALALSGSRTAWLGAFLGLTFWGWRATKPKASRRKLRPYALYVLGGGLVMGAGLAALVDSVTGQARLEARLTEVGRPDSTAMGRLYLWKTHLWSAPDLALLGTGPESFQRRWPEAQDTFLKNHPRWERFRSDLRHAHADVVEIAYDFGVPGVVLAVWLVLCFLRGPPRIATARRDPSSRPPATRAAPASLGSGVSLLVCGLFSPVLFFAPTLALASVALGARLGPPDPGRGSSFARSPYARRLMGAAIILALGLTLYPLSRRVVSELDRCRATVARRRGHNERALAFARRAVASDRRNPRAGMELGWALEARGFAKEARRAWRRVAVDLPTDGVVRKLEGELTATRTEPSGGPYHR